ncbi:fructose-1,6-bisphosphatase [Bacillus sp. NTK071]|uniref:fructose-1,6-bisphosphatase n=1 Tax=Bacillus sp. NTK071 TaxID=2802175 RepID=UPI001A8F75A4|nr:fructose-1,6-bisphosphatase [Bacillus sp. NTK071]MBN8209023.1 fructose-1,6-bisphosphatase [Bacillus sp. NTK071]
MNTKYLDLLAQKYNSEDKVVTEIINLKAILNLPKGTEHFVSDLHGEYQAFQHVLRNGSGKVKEKITDLFADLLTDQEMNEFATLVYYPEEKIKLIKNGFNNEKDLYQWYTQTIERMLKLISYASSKYTRSKLRKALPTQFVYVIEELLYKTANDLNNKEAYYEKILQQMIALGQADKLLTGLAYTTQRLVVDHLHVVGDIYDRGPEPDKIMETLIHYHSVDIQWGNHDVLWIGAFAGSKVCLANIIRICARYNNLEIIEDVYGINLRPLLNLAEKYYDDNPAFRPKVQSDEQSSHETLQSTKIHQAIAMIQFKLESPIIKRRSYFNMSERLLLEKIDYDNQEITIHGQTYSLENTCFATINPEQPDQLLDEEKEVMDKLLFSLQHSEKLARHMNFLMKKGSLYLKYNGNLLIHGCIPLDEKGKMEKMTIENKSYAGRDLLDVFENYLRHAFAHPEETDDLSTDMVWYLWTGEYSSLFGKREMTTFERYFIKDKESHKEKKNPYYHLREQEETCRSILTDFDLNPDQGHIINGHTPVKEIDGENPIKANGKMIVIDGGFSKAYQSTTGIAGYTLLFNSYGMQLVAHKQFNSKEEVLLNGADVLSVKRLVDKELERKKVQETNIGEELQQELTILKSLMEYRYIN